MLHRQKKQDIFDSLTPGETVVIKRDGKTVPYDEIKIRNAIKKAFIAVEGPEAVASSSLRTRIDKLMETITDTFDRRMPTGGVLDIEEIQDRVELTLMRAEHHKVARSYVLYREEHTRLRKQTEGFQSPLATRIQVSVNGELQPLDVDGLKKLVVEACADLEDVDPDLIVNNTLNELYEGISAEDVINTLIITARTMIEKEPDYDRVTARLRLNQIRYEALSFLELDSTSQFDAKQYEKAFVTFISKAIELGFLSPDLLQFDLPRLSRALHLERDMGLSYLGLQTLYDRYFIHHNRTRFELPQVFFMRIAMGLSLHEKDRNESTIKFYNLLSSFHFMSSTPTLFNSGTALQQLSSCYLSTVPDNLQGIFESVSDNAMLSKWAGGLGNDWTQVRALGSYIKGTNGRSQGVVPFLKVVNDTAVAVNQGGKRKGAVCCYLETWHLDIEEFLELRKNTGDDRRRTHDMHTANWVPDLFMQRLHEDSHWTLFSPDEVSDLHDLVGARFAKRYTHYESLTQTGEITLFKKVEAKYLWRKMLTMIFETGHPWITFKDACNLRSPQQHCGVVHSSNLCTEITLNTSKDEVAVCNLGSVNLVAHLDAVGEMDLQMLRSTVRTAIRMLDNVIDLNFYAIAKAKTSNIRHRPIGLGVMGFQDALFKKRIPFDSDAAVEFADVCMEYISYYAIEASSDLAVERGSYATYKGSLWEQGILPLDSLDILEQARGSNYLHVDRTSRLDWQSLRQKVQKQGMRNSNTLAIAPTATIANITNVCQSIEPIYQNLYVKSNLSGEFTVVNPYLIADLKKLGLWDLVMLNDLKFYDGSLVQIERVPIRLKKLYASAFEVPVARLLEAASRRQKWLDQSQSLNLYCALNSGKALDDMYRMAWQLGLKTTYYLRSLSATDTEKSSIENSTLNSVQQTPLSGVLACNIDDPDCEACQ